MTRRAEVGEAPCMMLMGVDGEEGMLRKVREVLRKEAVW